MTERGRRKAVVRTNGHGKEAAIVGDDAAVFFQSAKHRLFFNRPGVRNDETGFEPQPLAHCRIVHRSRGDARCVMVGRIDVLASTFSDDESDGMLKHSALAFIISNQRWK